MNHAVVKTIVFDWGNTLMQVFPEYEGPMVTWQRVAEVDGAHAALEILARSYRLVVATNAAQSSAEQVRAALNRVGLGEFIDSIYTVHELGARKPAPEFHGSLALRLGENPSGLVLVGDEFGNDVMGSYVAGWRSIWLNPDGKSAPALLPLQDGEITSLKELPRVLDGGWLPRYSECLAWLIGQKAGTNLLTHVQMVAAVAYALAVLLRRNGKPVNPILAHRGGLLHDLAKITGQENDEGMDHGEMAARLLVDRGQPVLAEIAQKHLLFGVLNPETTPHTWEEKLVYYADKLVEGGQLAGLDQRISALQRRYQLDGQILKDVLISLRKMEDEICASIPLERHQLLEQVRRMMWE